MKCLVLSLFVCAFVATVFSAPVEKDGEQLPPIGGPLYPIQPIILNEAKEALTQVQDNLRAAGRVEEALHLNKFLEKNEQLLEKGKSGVLQSERFDLEDHLDAVNSVLEKYKEYLPKQTKNIAQISLIVPSTKELYEHMVKLMDEMIVKLKEKNENDRAQPLAILKNAMDLLVKKDAHLTNSEEFANLIGEISETLAMLEKYTK